MYPKGAKHAASQTDKPHKDFPLFAHASGQWAKKIKGRLHYFGVWANPDAALENYLTDKDDLLAGRVPSKIRDGIRLNELVNQFLDAKRTRVVSGERSIRTWADYYRAAESMIDFFGANRLVMDLRPEDFTAYRAHLAQRRGPVAIANSIVRTRVILKWGFDSELLERPVRTGPEFRPPDKKVIRRSKRQAGSRVFEPEEIRRMLGLPPWAPAAGPIMSAMILLGVNCGFGQTDLANLPTSALDLEGGWVNHARTKTEVDRRCPLWPETVAAIREALTLRPAARDKADDGLLFITQTGRRWVRQGNVATSWTDAIANEFQKLVNRLGIERRGSFYNLRHTFRTLAHGAKDRPAANLIMGHTTGGMDEEYRHSIDDTRLQAVANHVRHAIFSVYH